VKSEEHQEQDRIEHGTHGIATVTRWALELLGALVADCKRYAKRKQKGESPSALRLPDLMLKMEDDVSSFC
jgi:hypothetical protein